MDYSPFMCWRINNILIDHINVLECFQSTVELPNIFQFHRLHSLPCGAVQEQYYQFGDGMIELERRGALNYSSFQ